jgi:hypothetical protein
VLKANEPYPRSDTMQHFKKSKLNFMVKRLKAAPKQEPPTLLKNGNVILKKLGINTFIAVKNFNNNCSGKNDFYKTFAKIIRTEYDPHYLAIRLSRELHYHVKEFAQYQ